MNGALFRPRSCGNCLHLWKHPSNGQPFCTRMPPSAAPVPAKDPLGRLVMVWQGSFPPVELNWKCGEHVPAPAPLAEHVPADVGPVGAKEAAGA
jgi:hypothetical protein